MNDKALLELALSKVETQLVANIKSLSIGRNLNIVASDLNSLVVAKANIEKLFAALPKIDNPIDFTKDNQPIRLAKMVNQKRYRHMMMHKES